MAVCARSLGFLSRHLPYGCKPTPITATVRMFAFSRCAPQPSAAIRVDDVLLHERLETPAAAGLTDAGPLRATERRLGRERDVLVDPDRAGVQLLCDRRGALRVRRPDGGTQAEVRGVRALERVVER